MDFLYHFFQNLGFAHPLHPPLTHMPIGLVVGAFIFLLSAKWFKRKNRLSITALHCLVLAFVFLFPAVFFGFSDWLHFYAGVWLFEIKVKIGFSIALFLFLVIGILVEIKKFGGFMSRSIIYLLCVICVISLGYFGGNLVYGR